MWLRKAVKVAKKRLRNAHDCMRRKDEAGFYEEMLKALWGYLGDKLSMPTSELSRDNVSDKLISAGVSQQGVNEAIALIDQCEFAKYASSAGADMQSVYDAGCRFINRIEQEIVK